MSALEQKTARLTVLIDPAKKKAFENLCAAQDVTPSQVVRKLIRDHLRKYGVQWRPGGDADESSSAMGDLD
ncbi:CopG family transcriptional regulator [Ottowia sp.]|uniref:CopG family transcriptional regulator n=1 Tax=Ottowia sp. TaxID=1898956 RepID=UPI0026295D5D|nr:CopG family transcriptional regulator [Ottowia sp.]